MLGAKSLLAASLVCKNWLRLCQSDRMLKTRIHSQLCKKKHKALSYEDEEVKRVGK
jgi:hypothetical protein